MNPSWPQQRSSQETIKSTARIHEALEWIYTDLTWPENAEVWMSLAGLEPERTRTELFDCGLVDLLQTARASYSAIAGIGSASSTHH
jgi:hypothetical protein